MGPPNASPSTESPAQRRVTCRPVSTHSNLPEPGSPNNAMEQPPNPSLPPSCSTCCRTFPAYSGLWRPAKISRIIACWSFVKNCEIFLSVIIQLLSTFERSGWSNEKQTDFFCPSVRLLYSVATSVSEVAFGTAAFPACEAARVVNGPAAATVAAPTIVVLRKVRRVTPRQHSQSS